MVQHLYFLFQLVSSFKMSRLAWKQHALMVPYGTEFDVLKFLFKTYIRV